MAVFDIAQQRMCVRVVYDGVASAGKTTNLRQLAELFATQRTGELMSPAEMDGRTLYFDWLQIAAGMVSGFPLVCQVITVPGQVVLTPRRLHLLRTADVVVHVCDSAEQTGARAMEGLTLFDEIEKERGYHLPLVIQANKQDQADAMSGPALAAVLGRAGVPVLEAIASDGIGVVDTFVAAVRGAVRSIQARVDSGEVRVAIQNAETASEVLQRLTAVEVDPEWAVEMLLEEASNAFVIGEQLANDSEAESESEPAPEPAEEELPPTTRHPGRILAGAIAPLPTEHVPTGFIWPAHTGRAALRTLAAEPEMKPTVALEENGWAHVTLGELVLTTSRDRKFESAETARQALVRAARERTQLGPLLAPETVLVAQPGTNGSTWLWTIVPRMPTIASIIQGRDRPELSRETVLASFGSALVDALKIEATHGTMLDLSPASFGVWQGIVRYVGDIGAADARDPRDASDPRRRDVGQAVLRALSSLAALSDELEPALVSFDSGLRTRLSDDERALLARDATWNLAAGVAPAVSAVRGRLEEAFKRGLKAA